MIYVIFGLLAALLFGAGAQFSKLLLESVEPMMMAGLVYLGSGFGLFLILAVLSGTGRKRHEREAGLARREIPWLLLSMLFGSILGPVTLMHSLPVTPAATAALLLNFEAVATTFFAVVWSGEPVGKRIWGAIVLIALACSLLTFNPGATYCVSVGALGVILACTFWGFDNNILQRIAGKDPITAVMIKGLGAGSIMVMLAISLGETFPAPATALAAMAIGSVGFGGLMGVCLVLSIRGLGSSRGAALFSLSPFFGLVFAFLIFAQIPNLFFFPALLLMIGGSYLLLTEEHTHMHTHPAEVHEHRHRHDDGHHEHAHDAGTPPMDSLGYHSHPHEHTEIEHAHTHSPDIHHRHRH